MDAFSKCHPAVNFVFFLGAIGTGVLVQHPAYLLALVVTGGVYYLLLSGAKGWKTVGGLLPLLVFLTVINPIFNTRGDTHLFYLVGRPYTLEALAYGAAVAAMFVGVLLWFGCYNRVLTSDKFTSLFGGLIPAVSLLLVMVLRMVPNFMRKARQITGARRAIGRNGGGKVGEKLADGMAVVDVMTAWALEGGVITGDSMRSRGYGAAQRTSFLSYRMKATDWLLLGLMGALLGLVAAAALLGQTGAQFVPQFTVSEISWGVGVYSAYLLIPIILHTKEAVQWHISRSRL
jgi:energy-coupling factor transport system permease protein